MQHNKAQAHHWYIYICKDGMYTPLTHAWGTFFFSPKAWLIRPVSCDTTALTSLTSTKRLVFEVTKICCNSDRYLKKKLLLLGS